ncbi:MAG: hypothetical protein QM650_11610 [Microlunatus sp.]
MDRGLSRRSMLGLLAGLSVTGLALPGLAGCGSGNDPVEPLPAEELVFGASFASPWFSSLDWALQTPYLVLYGSGRIVRQERSNRLGPETYTTAQIDPLVVARLVADAEQSGLLTRDYGTIPVTDLGGTRVWLHGAAGQQEVSVYGMEEDFDKYAGVLDRRYRKQLRALISDAQALVGDSGTPYVPERVVVLEQRTKDAATIRWPGPDPDTFLHKPSTLLRSSIACGELTGKTAATVYAAARANTKQLWLVGKQSRVLAVNPLPVEIDC